MKFQIEWTDTFCGEANYSWVKRATFDAPEHATRATLIRRGKHALDLTSRHRASEYSDTIQLDFIGEHTRAFITPLPSHLQPHKCGDCGKTWIEEELKPIKHLEQRVAPGEEMPSGECPDCGALCHASE